MGHVEDSPGSRFATFILNARRVAGWTQERLLDAADISKSTLHRWENGRTTAPEPANVRQACLALGVDPVEAVIALGFVTREEVNRPAPPPPVDPALIPANTLLNDPTIDDTAKNQLRTVIGGAVEFWFSQLGIRPARREPAPKVKR